jgi:hypothetical protein
LSADLREEGRINIVSCGLCGDFQSDGTRENEADAGKPKQRRGLVEKIDTERRSASRAKARPNPIGRADRQRLKGQAEASDTT